MKATNDLNDRNIYSEWHVATCHAEQVDSALRFKSTRKGIICYVINLISTGFKKKIKDPMVDLLSCSFSLNYMDYVRFPISAMNCQQLVSSLLFFVDQVPALHRSAINDTVLMFTNAFYYARAAGYVFEIECNDYKMTIKLKWKGCCKNTAK